MAYVAMAAKRALTAEQRYLFDLRGYLIIRNAIPDSEIAECRHAISVNMDKFKQREGALRNAQRDAFCGTKGRFDCGTMLHWEKPYCDVFRKFLSVPKLSPLLTELCGPGFRIDHLPLATIQYKESDGFDLHGGALDENGTWQQELSYNYQHGTISCNLLNISFALDETKEGDGGFVIIPGSHKANFPLPESLAQCTEPNGYLVNPALKPGDVLIFSEATCHGALPWKGESDSRINLFYRYCPANFAYGRGYLENFSDIINELSEAEKSVLQPPFVNRLDRVQILEDNKTNICERSQFKKDYDKEVFDCEYF